MRFGNLDFYLTQTFSRNFRKIPFPDSIALKFSDNQEYITEKAG